MILLEWSDRAVAHDLMATRDVLDGVVTSVAESFERYIGLWA
ncbi:MAG: hypothetical protein ABI706_07165 [Ilumatobacteraceae bacterium]